MDRRDGQSSVSIMEKPEKPVKEGRVFLMLKSVVTHMIHRAPRTAQEEERRGPRARDSLAETLQYVGEEEEEGVVYSVYQRSTNTQQAPVKVLTFRAGTLQRLVFHLLDARMMGDTTYIPVFLATYRAFTSTNEVLSILLDRLEKDSESQNADSKQRNEDVSSLFFGWMSQYPKDFLSLEPEKRQRLATCLSKLMKANLVKRLQEVCTEKKDEQETSSHLGNETGPSDPLDILTFQAGYVAEQLTSLEASLFLRVVPFECLGSVWSRRDRGGEQYDRCHSVRETVRHFNRLSWAVTASCVQDPQLKPQQRARVIEKWVRVAEECRILRNFSSVYAILSALQSTSVHRLKSVWAEISREALRSYQEMSEIFSEKDNYARMRELLFQSQDPLDAVSKKNPNRSKEPRAVVKIPLPPLLASFLRSVIWSWDWTDAVRDNLHSGVVPYLGIFLTDLVMLDSAIRDQLENGYLNFEKRRKEFESLSQIRILQSVCLGYRLHSDPQFVSWFQRIQPISEADSYQLSCGIERTQDSGTSSNPAKPTVVITHCTDLLAAIAAPFGPSMHLVSWDTPCDRLTTLGLTPHQKSPSVSALDVQGSPKPPAKAFLTINSTGRTHRRSASCGSCINSSTEPCTSSDLPAEPPASTGSTSEHRIIRARVEPATENSVYKSVLISSQEKAPAIIDRILKKHHMTPQGPQELVQLLPGGKELVIPGKANVFYAMNSNSLDFLLRPCQTALNVPPPEPHHHKTQISATFPKVKAKAGDLARALF